jgi:hypothetical protein
MHKLLVANRGEIAVRVLRAANELQLQTVCVYTPEDGEALHRTKADEAYQLGEPGHPVRGYLDVEALIEVAQRCGADALHPGYGFLSESAALAQACADAGIVFVGPPAEVLRLTGDKVSARDAAVRAGLPVLRASTPLPDGAGARTPPRRSASRCSSRPPPAVAGEGCDWSPTGRPGRRRRQRLARGRRGVRRRHRLPGAGGHGAAAHRGAGARRRHR